jgi:midasin (ATPase involved in ribosome maturation)
MHVHAGGTGVGKSATIQAAAAQCNKRLIRFNMSSTVTVDSLLGQVKLVTTAEGESLQLQPQPFTTAFTGGHWLLLDEINLVSTLLLLLKSSRSRSVHSVIYFFDISTHCDCECLYN